MRVFGFLVGASMILGAVIYASYHREIVVAKSPGALQQAPLPAPRSSPHPAGRAASPDGPGTTTRAGTGAGDLPGAARMDRSPVPPAPGVAQESEAAVPMQGPTAEPSAAVAGHAPVEVGAIDDPSAPHRPAVGGEAGAADSLSLNGGARAQERSGAPTAMPEPAPEVPADAVDPLFWQPFWGPFNTLASARGFADNVAQRTGLDIRPLESSPGAYMVAFPYQSESEREALKALIEKRTGLDIRIP